MKLIAVNRVAGPRGTGDS